jgi:succinylarginine dihydrolase
MYELNIDGLVGPSHHYAGLSPDNKASTKNALSPASPLLAARQGLSKMRLLHQLGIKQAVMPPHQRPNLHFLYQMGFSGSTRQIIQDALRTDQKLLSAAFSASSMWTANAATVSSSLDTQDRRVHFTAANLISTVHRHQEADFSHTLLKHLFANQQYFHHHPILPKTLFTRDEGAANHSRLANTHAHQGINLFVYGQQMTGHNHHASAHLARQTLEASRAIVRSHQLHEADVVFACQNPQAIAEGVFHNDLVAVANEYVLLIHEDAFLNQRDVINELKTKSNYSLQIIEVKRRDISLKMAVSSYLFNSQLVTVAPNQMALIAPIECEEEPTIHAFLNQLLASTDNPINQVHFINLKQSMRNGGGPACLRLRVPLTELELSAMHQSVLVDDELLDTLDAWVEQYYRPELHACDLHDPALIDEWLSALDTLTTILKLGSIYPFQQL